ncbi:MAG TPA: M50 family metallopeptidase [Actinomycetota bacterium]|nr:M50 family metallopeptidase [Actinomycetota bacterium]
MSGTLGVIIFIATLVFLVMFHETGHYLAARAFGMKIEEFFFGFGPRLFSWRRGETEYGMKAIPAGGYVKIAGMAELQLVHDADPGRGEHEGNREGNREGGGRTRMRVVETSGDPSEEHRMFRNKPAWQRAIVLVAGSTTHFILAFLLLTFSFAALGTIGNPTTTLNSVSATQGSLTGTIGPAARAGMQPGDTIVGADGAPVANWDAFSKVIRSHANEPVTLQVRRHGRLITLTVTPESKPNPDAKAEPKTIGFIGVSARVKEDRQALPKAAWSGISGVGTLMWTSVQGIGDLFSPSGLHQLFSAVSNGQQPSGSSGASGTNSSSGSTAVGLVGGARLAGDAAKTGQGQALIEVLAVFIVFLGVINLAPLPPLDGGHLLILGIEKLRGRAVDSRKVAPVAALVLSLLVTLSLVVLYLDVFHPAANPFQ